MKKGRHFLITACLLLPVLAGAQTCVDFTSLNVGDTFGQATHSPGDHIFTENGIKVYIDDFYWTGGGGTFNFCRAENSFGGFGTTPVMMTNNINLTFDFTDLPFQVMSLSVFFADLGGNENIAVNGHTMHVGELNAAPPNIAPGVNIAVFTYPITGGKQGFVAIKGPINTLTIGGQEFWLDDLCARDIEVKCVTFETVALTTQFGSGTQTAGDVIFVEDDIPVSVWDFDWGTGTAFNLCQIDPAFDDFGHSHTGQTNNINLMFDFSNLPFTPNHVEFEYADLGGIENLSVNSQPLIIGELDAAGPVLAPGVFLDVSVAPMTGGKHGRGVISGAVQTLVLGGQEFWLDNICAWDTLATGIDPKSVSPDQPRLFELSQNYPNPFNPETEIRYGLPEASFVQLSIHDLKGRHIRTLHSGSRKAGVYTAHWDGRDESGLPVPSGVYIYRLTAGMTGMAKKLTLLR